MYIDSIRCEDKVADRDMDMFLPPNPILLMHDPSNHVDQEQIEKVFTNGTVFVASTLLCSNLILVFLAIYLVSPARVNPAFHLMVFVKILGFIFCAGA